MTNIKKILLAIAMPILSCGTKVNASDKAGEFVKSKDIPENAKYAYFASGCFWGTEYWFEKADGVFEVVSGYTGGHKSNPTYKEVSSGLTGHLEAVRVGYDPSKTTYEELVKLFFETHDFTQTNGQGPDIGSQYLSAIFYETDDERAVAQKYIDTLVGMGNKVATTLKTASKFWVAENYHQDYYGNNGQSPYCHFYKKIF